MCVAIVIPAGKRISLQQVRACHTSNDDGCGLAYVKGKTVKIIKGLFEPDEFYQKYLEVADTYGDKAMLMHFRIATMGRVADRNCHPFSICGGAMIHNGSLWSGPLTNDKSDTAEFAEMFGKMMKEKYVSASLDKIDKAVSYNKLAMLYGSGRYYITNSNQWHNIDGVLFSNINWKRFVDQSPTLTQAMIDEAWDEHYAWGGRGGAH